MKEQLERDIEVLRKIERLLNEELSQATFNEHNFLAEWKEFRLAKSDLEFRLKSLATKEQQDTDLLKESIDLVSKAEELAFKTSITDRQSLSNQFFRLKNRLGALKHKGKVKDVTIWDVIEECKGVTRIADIIPILDKYEYSKMGQSQWIRLSLYIESLDIPISFNLKYQLRLKEQK